MFPPAFGRHIAHRPLDQLQERLLHTFAGDISRQGRILRLAADLVDLIDIDDARFGPGNVVIAILKQLEDHILNILSHISGLSQCRRIGNGKGDMKDTGQGLGQQRLPGPGRADHEDVPLFEIDVLEPFPIHNPLVMIVHGDGEDFLGTVLPDHIFIELGLDVRRLGDDQRKR